MATTDDMPDDMNGILGPNEKVELYIKEKIYAPQLNIDSLVITNTRIILRHPHSAGLKRDYTDYGYSNIQGVQLDKGVMRSTIRLLLKPDGKSLELGRLPIPLADKGYGIIRENVGRFQAPLSTGNANPTSEDGLNTIMEASKIPDETPNASPEETAKEIPSTPDNSNPTAEEPKDQTNEKMPSKGLGRSIVAVPPKEKDKGKEMSKTLMISEPKVQTEEEVSNSIGVITDMNETPTKRESARYVNRPKVQMRKKTSLKRVGKSTIANTPKEEDKSKDEPKALSGKITKVQTRKKTPVRRVGKSVVAIIPNEEDKEKPEPVKESRIKVQKEEEGDHSIEAPPATKEAISKKEPAEKADAFNCSIGWIELNGKRYDFDVIVHVDGSVTKREKALSKKKKKKYGHTPVTRSELKVLEKEAPVMIIIGTGQSGSMPLTPKAEKFLEGHLYFVGKTPEALKKLATSEEKTIALLHVTC